MKLTPFYFVGKTGAVKDVIQEPEGGHVSDEAGGTMDRRHFGKLVASGALALGLSGKANATDSSEGEFVSSSEKPVSGEHEVDVVIVGAGLSGLMAARELKRAKKSVLVLEARSRIGGRMFLKKTIEDGVLDVGGQWVGPTQTAMLSLLDELKIEKYDSYQEGNSILSWNHEKSHFDGNVSKVLAGVYGNTQADRDAQARVCRELMSIAATVPAATPWTAPNAKALDSQTFESWLESVCTLPFSKWPWSLQARLGGSGGFEPSQSSLLHMAWTQVVGPQREMPETWLLHGGAGQIPPMLAQELGDRILLNAPVLSISQDSSGIAVTTSGLRVRAKAVVVAIPPPLRAGIHFSPALPPLHAGLIQRMPMGSMAKVHAVYPTAFWRSQGLSGTGAGNLKTCEFIVDGSPPSGKPGILTSFIAADRNLELGASPRETIRRAVMEDIVYYFGKEAATPAEFFYFNWNAQNWTTGAFTSYMPPGVWTSYGPAWREPVGSIFWAGTEVATRWPGYFDGAVRAGLDSAKAVLEKVG